MNIQQIKQLRYTWSCLLNLSFFECFCYCWKVMSLLVLNLFVSQYLEKIFPWKQKKFAFSVKLQIEYLCSCLRSKLSKTQAVQTKNIMEYLPSIIRISESIPAVNNLHWSVIMNMLLLIQRSLCRAKCKENRCG